MNREDPEDRRVMKMTAMFAQKLMSPTAASVPLADTYVLITPEGRYVASDPSLAYTLDINKAELFSYSAAKAFRQPHEDIVPVSSIRYIKGE